MIHTHLLKRRLRGRALVFLLDFQHSLRFLPLIFLLVCIQLNPDSILTYALFGFSLSQFLRLHSLQICLTNGQLSESVKCSCWLFLAPI